jgi:hypothetical protein
MGKLWSLGYGFFYLRPPLRCPSGMCITRDTSARRCGYNGLSNWKCGGKKWMDLWRFFAIIPRLCPLSRISDWREAFCASPEISPLPRPRSPQLCHPLLYSSSLYLRGTLISIPQMWFAEECVFLGAFLPHLDAISPPRTATSHLPRRYPRNEAIFVNIPPSNPLLQRSPPLHLRTNLSVYGVPLKYLFSPTNILRVLHILHHNFSLKRRLWNST